MTVNEIKEILEAKVLCCEDKCDLEVHTACGSDMMSDVLAFVKDKCVLLTGLTNTQVVRTAEMMDVVCIVFIRGKMPNDEILELAVSMGIPVLATERRMFNACGLLYTNGLRGGLTQNFGTMPEGVK
jgi:predicted transcriptional regulator